jgi:hypothetical protein
MTVTGTISDSGNNVWVNGIEVSWYDENDWYADAVPVSPTGTAIVNVEAGTDTNDIVALQTLDQPQPAVISLMSYASRHYDEGTIYNYCYQGATTSESQETINWLYSSGGMNSGGYNGYDGDCQPENDNYADSLAGGYNGYSPIWECNDVNESSYVFYPGEGIGGHGDTIADSQTTDAKTHVMIVPPGQQAIGQSALYLVMAQVLNEDTGLQLAASAVRFVNQLAGTASEDVTNDDGSVWTTAMVCSPAGVPTEVTPVAPGNYSFAGMKLSPAIIVYFSFDPTGEPGSFHANDVESLLQLELSTNVFDGLPTGHSVQVKVRDETTPKGKPGWNGNPKTSYFNRVSWTDFSAPSSRGGQALGTININDGPIEQDASQYTRNVSAQTWVNILAHEGIWGNAGGNSDCYYIPFIRTCTDGDISAGALGVPAYLFDPYIVTLYSRTALRSEFGF